MIYANKSENIFQNKFANEKYNVLLWNMETEREKIYEDGLKAQKELSETFYKSEDGKNIGLVECFRRYGFTNEQMSIVGKLNRVNQFYGFGQGEQYIKDSLKKLLDI